jgi:hypothetical protein
MIHNQRSYRKQTIVRGRADQMIADELYCQEELKAGNIPPLILPTDPNMDQQWGRNDDNVLVPKGRIVT